MSHGYPSLPRIQAHLEQLRLQEEDAKKVLSQPEVRPGVHGQIRALLQRIADERAGLQASVLENFGNDPIQ